MKSRTQSPLQATLRARAMLPSRAAGLALLANAGAGFLFFVQQQVPWLGDRSPAQGGGLALLALSPAVYAAALKGAAAVLAAQALAAALLALVRDARAAWGAAAEGFRPFRWAGAVALVCLLPLFPLSGLGHFLRFALLLSLAARAVGLLWPGPGSRPSTGAARLGLPGLALFLAVLAAQLFPWREINTSTRRSHGDYLLVGDQPSYLLIAESLVRDRDTNLANNRLPPHVSSRQHNTDGGGVNRHNPGLPETDPLFRRLASGFGNGEWSTHRPGTSLLIAPFYKLGDWMGNWQRLCVTLFLVLVVSAAVRELFFAACASGVDRRLAWVLSFGAGISVPVVCMATAIYPEIFVFYFVARMLRCMAEDRGSAWRDLEMGGYLALAPWLQDKYGLWALPFFAAALLRRRHQLRRVLLLLAAPTVSAILMARTNLFLYGRILPRNTVGGFLSPWEALPGGLPGAWFDWGYGLAVLAPFVFAAPAGFWLWRRREPGPAARAAWACALSVTLVGWLLIGTWNSWHGGFTPPTRFMLTLLPACALAAMVATGALPPAARNVTVVLWLLSAAFGIECLSGTDFWYSRRHPAYCVTQWLGLVPFAVRYPSFYEGEPWRNLAGIAAAIAGAAAMLFLGLEGRGKGNSRRRRVALSATLAACGIAAAVPQGPNPVAAPDIATSGGVLHHIELGPGDDGHGTLRFTFTRSRGTPLPRLAVSVHFLDASGKMVGQDDFGLQAQIAATLRARPELEAARGRSLLVERAFRAPTNAAAVRIGLYMPHTGRVFPNQWRSPTHILPWPHPAPSKATAQSATVSPS